MSNKVENMNSTAPSSVTLSAKKPRKLVIRQTLTSKLRAERGDKLQFIKNEIQKLEEKKEKLHVSSTESLKTDNKFKKPTIPVNQKPPASTAKTVNLKGIIKTAPVNNTPVQKRPISTPRTAPIKKDIKKDTPCIKITPASSRTLNNNKLLEKDKHIKARPSTAPISGNQNLRRPTTASLNKNVSKPAPPKDLKTSSNRFSLAPIRQTLPNKFDQGKGKYSLLPNQIKPIPVDNPRRQTFMAPAKKPVEIKKPIPPKSAMKQAGSISSIKKSVTLKSPLRKSITAMHFKRVSNLNRNSTIHRTVSWSDLSPNKLQSPKEPIFRTPTMAKRRSVVFQTPMSAEKIPNSPLQFSVVSTPTTADLKRRLSLWLQKKGKALDSFHHLRCFGIKAGTEIEEENKENFEVFIPDLNSSYEDLKIKKEERVEKEDTNIANDAMYDLHRLILEKYPREQCEAWLDIICGRFPEVQDRPQYWECRAALEEARGNYKTAIDCYSNAIVKGAEVEKVYEPLDNLLEKFSVLNINQFEPKEKTPQKTLDARNVFKSSIICFAIQERDRKSLEDGCRFVATPVRRSTRQSRSHFVSTPTVKLSTTLEDLEQPVRQSLHFQTNKAFK